MNLYVCNNTIRVNFLVLHNVIVVYNIIRNYYNDIFVFNRKKNLKAIYFILRIIFLF